LPVVPLSPATPSPPRPSPPRASSPPRSGSITSPRLLELSLANNCFEGPLPDFSQPKLRFVDVSNNNISGRRRDPLHRGHRHGRPRPPAEAEAEGRTRFEIEDLLRALAEVLGSGNFGSSYKATLCEGPAVVVKRFKDMNGVGREDFSEHMRHG
ncbi:hypothetical protein BAE44_0013915, partial [Dichanthelium oligosanthes]